MTASGSSPITIEGGLVFDPRAAEPVACPVHIADGVIVALEGDTPADAEVVDATGKLVVPGLIDAHFHAYGIGLDLLRIESSPTSYVATVAAHRLRATLRRGFTTVRDVAGGDSGLARALDEGLIDGPRYVWSGRGLSQTGGHGDPHPGGFDLCCGGGHVAEVVDGVDALRRAVRERFRSGAHLIKVFASGGVVSPTDPLRRCQYSAEELRAVCDEAQRRGSYVAAHAYSPEAVTHAVTNGVRSIEHGNLIDERTAALMAEHGAYLVPTLVTYRAMADRGDELGLPAVSAVKNREVLDAGIESIDIARRNGVPIGFGTDLMGALEDEQLHGFREASAAMSAHEMIVAATVTNAELLGRPELGVIQPSTPADLVIFDANPLESVDALWTSSRTVVKAGAVVS